MFPVECKSDLPVDHMLITSVSVRGMLGPMTVWVSKESGEDTEEDGSKMDTDDIGNVAAAAASLRYQAAVNARGPRESGVISISVHSSSWHKIYEREHSPSTRDFVELKLDTPIKLRPNQLRGIYIHSKNPGDEAVVYDNQKEEYTHDDKFLIIRPGLAHLCNKPFGRSTIWGWGSPWRENREFVGRLSYGKY